MKFELWTIGKTNFKYLEEGMKIYEKRLSHYLKFSTEIIPNIKNAKNLNPAQLIEKESDIVLKKINTDDLLVVLDEKGKQFSSVQFSKKIENWQLLSQKKVIFLIGGAYGFSDKIYQRANEKIAFSQMTFSHQMIRLFVLEQIYRGMTILRGEPYHNE